MKVFYFVFLSFMCIIGLLSVPMAVSAAPANGATSASATSAYGATHDDFDYLANGKSASSAEKTVLGIGATIYQMLLKIGIFGVVIALILCGISFLIKGSDSKERSELKMWLLRIGIVLVIMTSLTSIAGLVGGLLTGVF